MFFLEINFVAALTDMEFFLSDKDSFLRILSADGTIMASTSAGAENDKEKEKKSKYTPLQVQTAYCAVCPAFSYLHSHYANFCPQFGQKLAPVVFAPQFGQKFGFAAVCPALCTPAPLFVWFMEFTIWFAIFIPIIMPAISEAVPPAPPLPEVMASIIPIC